MKIKPTNIGLCLFLFFATNSAIAQNLFPEKFDGCTTDQFALESDTTTAKFDSDEFIIQLTKHFGTKLSKKIKGELQLQIIVDLEGNSCLISLKNETNVKTEKLDLKKWIDESVKWQIPTKKVSPIIYLDFSKSGIKFSRIGLNGKKGWHTLD